MRDLHNSIAVSSAFDSATIATDTTTAGNIIDLQGYDACEFVIQSGTLTDGAYAILVEAGNAANLSDNAAVADKDLLGSEADAGFALADDDTVKTIGVVANNTKRYVRMSIVSTATTSGGVFSASVVLGQKVK